MDIRTNFTYSIKMFVFIPGSIRPVRFEPAGTVPAEISIWAVTTYNPNKTVHKLHKSLVLLMPPHRVDTIILQLAGYT